jgi:tetratricopeptide (TPR) repeat protein
MMEMRRIVFIGNCQMLALHDIYRQFVGDEAGDDLTYIPSYEAISEEHTGRIGEAHVVVEQVSDMPPAADIAQVPTTAERRLVPVVSGGFLWPFASEPHPRNEGTWFLPGGPYPATLGDGFLNRLIREQVPPEDAVRRYIALDIARVGNLDRRYELFIDRQRRRDEICDYSITDLIVENFRTEQLFLSPHHPNLRVTLSLVEQFLRRMGAPDRAIVALRAQLRITPFPKDELPIHPAVAAHFGLHYAHANRRYRYLNEGNYSFEEYAHRYLRYEWNPDIAEGIALAPSDPPAAMEKLRAGLVRTPGSASAYYVLADIWAQLGQVARAEFGYRAAMMLDATDAQHPFGLARLLLTKGDAEQAARVINHALAIDPSSPHLAALRTVISERLGMKEGQGVLVDTGAVAATAPLDDGDLAQEPSPPQRADANPPLPPAFGSAVPFQLWSWAVKETAIWQARRPDRREAFEIFRNLHETEYYTHLITISDGVVNLAEKPRSLIGSCPHDDRRAVMYRDYIQSVVKNFCPDLTTQLVIDTTDARRRNDDVPVFVFQKPFGCTEIVLPDVDFFHHDFYDGNQIYEDTMPYGEKDCRAIFVGSTTGGIISIEAAKSLSYPRLRSAVHFRNDPDVTFLLPNIVQCDSVEASRILREYGIGAGERISWNQQFRYKFIISMDGNGATCSRVVVALKSNSVLLKYDSPHSLYYFPGLCPWVHYIPISDDEDVRRIIEAERRRPGLFAHIAAAGKAFADAYVARQSTMQYTAWLLQLYDSCFVDRGRAPDGPLTISGACVDGAPRQAAAGPIVEILAHVQDTGDRRYSANGWVGVPGSGRYIEGVSVEPGPEIPHAELGCQVVYADGTGSAVAIGGQFAGTRGKSLPIVGFRLSLSGRSAMHYAGSYRAAFIDGFVGDQVSLGDLCVSPSGAPLEALRISLHRLT